MPPKSKRVLPGKRYPLNMRTTKELRDKIEEAAMASGRSLVQEVEFRLERSFQQQEIEKELERKLGAFRGALLDEISKDRQQWRDKLAEMMGETGGPKTPGLLDLDRSADSPEDTSRPEVRALSDDELAKRIAEAEAAEQMGQAQKQPKPPDFKVPSPHEDTSEQPATDKREDSK